MGLVSTAPSGPFMLSPFQTQRQQEGREGPLRKDKSRCDGALQAVFGAGRVEVHQQLTDLQLDAPPWQPWPAALCCPLLLLSVKDKESMNGLADVPEATEGGAASRRRKPWIAAPGHPYGRPGSCVSGAIVAMGEET